MTYWNEYFDRIFLINLKSRKDRLIESAKELSGYNIQFERFEAAMDEDGARGLWATMKSLFEMSLQKGYKRILVFEDDIKFLLDPKETMDLVVNQLPIYFDLLYLGCNHPVKFEKFYSPNLLYCERALSTHAVSYSRSAMRYLLQNDLQFPSNKTRPIDLNYADGIQKSKMSFCVYPFLCSQKSSYSDIEKTYVSHYNIFLENRFEENVKHLLP